MLIKINVEEKRAQVLGSPVIVCGNTDHVVEFTFDEEWAATQTRTARFVYVQDGQVKYTDVVFTGSTAAVPLLSNTKEVKVGVFAGDLRTTTPARIPCEPSILCGTGAPEEPTPSQYDQIVALLNEKSALDSVRFSPQELGEEQKSIARDNIGAASQSALEAADQNLSKRLADTQEGLESLTTSTTQSVNNLQSQVNDKAEVEEFELTLNADTFALETDDATLEALVAALDEEKNIKISIIEGSRQLCAYVTSHVNRFITAFHYMKRRLYTWRVYDTEVALYHDIGLLDDPIIDRGELKGWVYRKYESGVAELWRTISCWQSNSALMIAVAERPFFTKNHVITATLCYKAEENISSSRTIKAFVDGDNTHIHVYGPEGSFPEGYTLDVDVVIKCMWQ